LHRLTRVLEGELLGGGRAGGNQRPYVDTGHV
jgi:hypothetical protein